MDYPRAQNLAHLAEHYPGTSEFIRAWNLGLIEFLYLVPVNALILWLAFRTKRRPNAGLLVVLSGVLYAPVRFFLDFLRPEETDPRYLGLTFAQWSSFLAFGAAVYVAVKIFKTGKPAETITVTSGEAQRRLKLILKDTTLDEDGVVDKADKKSDDKADKKSDDKADLDEAEAKDSDEDSEDGEGEDESEDEEVVAATSKSGAVSKPGAPKKRGKRGGKARKK
jgi:hypothetical protein